MRLLHITKSGNLELKEFYATIPPYAILSHRWEEEEVLLEDLKNNTAIGKKGYRKMWLSCAQAAKDGFEYIWIDTCCIDKSSSVELQEAVNSMFSWYKKSGICYAYLSDCSMTTHSVVTMAPRLRKSKWFTRGWTLQELIAPTRMAFYDRDWGRLGSKADPVFKATISYITRVSLEVLDGQDLQHSSIAQRMSWASDRETTRPEDIAYCLLGLFDVTMPLVYGEGEEKAFLRLQEEIVKRSDDHSLFAWKLEESGCSHGLLAPHPYAFADSRHIIRTSPKSEYGFTNIGLRISLPLACSLKGGGHVALLNCQDKRKDARAGVYLLVQDDGAFVRVRLDYLVELHSNSNRIANYGKFADQVLYVPHQSIGQEPTVQEFHIHVSEETLYSSVERFFGYLAPSGLQTTKHEKNLLLTTATSSGRRTCPRTFDFTLRAGGTAGLLVRGYKYCSPRSGYAIKRYGQSAFALMTFRVSFEGEISWGTQAIKAVPDSLWTMKMEEGIHWLDEYLLDTELHLQGKDLKISRLHDFHCRVKVSNAARKAGDRDTCKRFEACVMIRSI